MSEGNSFGYNASHQRFVSPVCVTVGFIGEDVRKRHLEREAAIKKAHDAAHEAEKKANEAHQAAGMYRYNL